MTIAKILVCIGLLTVAGACGVLFGWLEKKLEERERTP